MDSKRIERALREGPPDEPAYVPGSFRRSPASGWWIAASGAAVFIALVVGIAIGTGLDTLRSGGMGGEVEPRVLVAADLHGVWESDPIERQVWVDALLERGFAQDDIDAFVDGGFDDRVRYALRFVDDSITVQTAYDELPFETLGSGTFTVLDNGTVQIIETVNGIQVSCAGVAAVTIDGDRLTMRLLGLSGCSVDERIGDTLFFEIAEYSRADE